MRKQFTTSRSRLPRTSAHRRAFTLVELVIVIGLILLLVAITVSVSVGVLRQSEVRETQNVMTILDTALQEWLLQEGREISYGRGANHPGVSGFGEPCVGQSPQRVYRLPQRAEAGDHTGWTEVDARDIAQEETDFLIATLLRRPVFEDMIASIDTRFMRRVQVNDPPEDQEEQPGDLVHLTSGDYLDFVPEYIYRFVDAWERPILAVHPGRAFQAGCDDPSGQSNYCIGTGASERCADDDGTIRTPLENVFGVAESRRIFFVSSGPSERLGMLHLHRAFSALTDPQKQQVDRAGDNIYSHPIQIDQARPQ